MEKKLEELQESKLSEEAKLPQAITCFPKTFERSLRASVRNLDAKIARIENELTKRREDHEYAVLDVNKAASSYQDAHQRYIRMCVDAAVSGHMEKLEAEFNICLSKLSEAMEVVRGEVLEIKPRLEKRLQVVEAKVEMLQLASALVRLISTVALYF
jgi:hypothetical protein